MSILTYKRCSKCGEVKSISEFSPEKTHSDRLASRCKKCNAEKTAAYRAKNKEKVLAATQKWRSEHKDEVGEYNKKYYTENLEYSRARGNAFSKRRYKENKNNEEFMRARRARQAEERKAVREKIFSILGHVCVRCGYTDKRALQVDHIHGGGNAENRKMTRDQFYRRVIEVGKAEYQILCANCNVIKNIENQEHRRRYDNS